MLKNVRYNKIKLLHELSCLVWFVEKHGIEDAKTAGDKETMQLMQNLKNDLQQYLKKIDNSCCCKQENGGCSACE